MLMHVTAVSYLVGACAYLVAAALILASRQQHRYKALLLAACVLTATATATFGAAALMARPPLALQLGVIISEQLRAAGWIAVIAFVLFQAYGGKISRGFLVGLGSVVAGLTAYNLAIPLLTMNGIALPAVLFRGVYLAHLAIAITALLLVENVFRNSKAEGRWSVKYLCFGLGLVFGYDFFVFAQATMLGQIDGIAFAARGFIQALAMPLIILSAARLKGWVIGVHVSRGFVFRSATLLGAGAYLVIMAAAGYSLRAFDGPWGSVSQLTFVMAGLVALAVVLCSGAAQARLKTFINQNFFTYQYDYRAEWLRFIDSMSGSADDLTIPERVVQALANIVGSASGKIWIKREEDQVFHAAAAWNMDRTPDVVPVTESWLQAFTARPEVVDLSNPAANKDVAIPTWLAAQTNARAILPLIHAGELVGFVILGELRAPRSFNWEDLQLLKTAARQAASYVAEERSALALAQVRRFEDFNQRFAFIVHDVKNLAAQMTLILKNAERHGNNPEFQKDMLQTVGDSVTRLRGMLEQLKNPRHRPGAVDLDLVSLLDDIADGWKLQAPKFVCDLPAGPVNVSGQPEQLRAVVGHLIQNAVDAAGPNGDIGLELHIEGVMRCGSDGVQGTGDGKCWAVITVADDGPGMDSKFVENQLFQPLRSTKVSGFGIGAFQARQVARDMGGRLDVESRRGRGTRVTVRLPYVMPANGMDKWNASRPLAKTAPLLRSA